MMKIISYLLFIIQIRIRYSLKVHSYFILLPYKVVNSGVTVSMVINGAAMPRRKVNKGCNRDRSSILTMHLIYCHVRMSESRFASRCNNAYKSALRRASIGHNLQRVLMSLAWFYLSTTSTRFFFY